jgi:fused signal recognition particle receptor
VSGDGSLLDRLRRGLSRTREVLETPVSDLVRGRRPLDAESLGRIEEALLEADMGVSATAEAIEVLKEHSAEIATGGIPAMKELLRETIRETLDRPGGAERFSSRPWVIFVVGVNGVGKTTTIGKLARTFSEQGKRVLVCAADTFRAAASEQLAVWAERGGASFHRGQAGADPASVLTDALRASHSRGHDCVLVDTAGRLHTKGNLMAELAKMTRVASRDVPGAPHETLLVLDATVGSNGLPQAREFARATPLTGLVLTKLDGTAKGGVAVAIVRELGLPIRYVGVGESAEDLLPFDAASFAEGLFPETL